MNLTTKITKYELGQVVALDWDGPAMAVVVDEKSDGSLLLCRLGACADDERMWLLPADQVSELVPL